MGCCIRKEPPDSQISSLQTPSLSRYQGEKNYSLYKVIVVGDAETGKASVLGSFTGDYFNPTYRPTIGWDFRIRFVELDEFRIKLKMWD